MQSRALALLVLVAAAILMFFLLRSSDGPTPGGPDGETPAEEPAREAELLGRAPPPKKRVVVATTKAKGKPPDESGAPTPAPTPKKRRPPGIGKLAESHGDEDTATLRVRVVDGSGRPRDRAHLVLYTVEKGVGRKSHDEPMGADGEIVIEKLKPGRRAIYVRIGSLQRMAATELVAGRVTEAVVPFPLGASVKGVVRHAETGPLEFIQVRLQREDGVFKDRVYAATDKNGSYALKDIPPGKYSVALTGKSIGYSPRPRCELVVPAAGSVEQDFVLGEVVLQGVVREAGSRRALSGVRVNLQGGLYVETSTNAQGVYEFRDVAPGEYTIAVAKDGYGFRFLKTGPIVAGATATVDIELTRAAALEMTVVDEAGKPIAGEVILSLSAIEPKDGTSLTTNRRTDASGMLRYAQIVPGKYEVGISSRGFGEVRKEVLVESGTIELRFELKRAGPLKPVGLTGVIRDAVTKRPIAGARLVMQSPVRREAVSDENGVYRVRNLRTATCVLHVGRDGYGIRFLRGIEVAAGKETTLDIELRPAAVLHLRLSKENGEPVVGGIVLSISPKRGTKGTSLGTGITADDNGTATYRQIVPGQYTLRVSQEGAGRASIETEVREGTNTFDLQLR